MIVRLANHYLMEEKFLQNNKVLRAMDKKIMISTIIGGIAVTLVTGLIESPSMLGATNYGYPFGWLTQLIVAPVYFPWRVHPIRLVLDVIVWSVLVWLVLYVVIRKKGS